MPWPKLLRRMLPTFFLNGYHLDIKKSALFAAGVFFAGVVSDAAGGLASDWLLKRTGSLVVARCWLIAAVVIASLACLVGVLFARDLTPIAPWPSGAFFFLEMVSGPIWVVPMDIAPDYAGTASGILNTGIITPVVFGIIVEQTGD